MSSTQALLVEVQRIEHLSEHLKYLLYEGEVETTREEPKQETRVCIARGYWNLLTYCEWDSHLGPEIFSSEFTRNSLANTGVYTDIGENK